MSWPVKYTTVEEYMGRAEKLEVKVRKKPASANASLWEGKDPRGGRLRLMWRRDRAWLVSLYKFSKGKWRQICQAKVPDEPTEGIDQNELEKKIVEAMKQVAIDVENGVVDDDRPFEHRNKIFDKRGLSLPEFRGGARPKAPAATIEPAPAPKRRKTRKCSDGPASSASSRPPAGPPAEAATPPERSPPLAPPSPAAQPAAQGQTRDTPADPSLSVWRDDCTWSFPSDDDLDEFAGW